MNMNLNNNYNASNQLAFSPYEPVQQPLQSGLSAMPNIPHMPGFTPMLVSMPQGCAFPQEMNAPQGYTAFPQEAMFAPIPQFQPFLFPQPVLQSSSQSQSPMQSPMFLPLQPVQFNPSMSPPLLSLNNVPPMIPQVMPSGPPQVSVSQPPQMTPSLPPQGSQNRTQFLGNDLRDVSRSRSASVCSDSDSGEHTRMRSVSRESEIPSKRALVDSTLGWMSSVFGDKYDNDGTRGENVLRLKVKTVIALEHIVEFISRCHSEGLIESISCPVSTKKGRQHVRGYLAYIKGFSGSAADRIEAIFENYNQEKGFPFKTLHRNPASTL